MINVPSIEACYWGGDVDFEGKQIEMIFLSSGDSPDRVIIKVPLKLGKEFAEFLRKMIGKIERNNKSN